MILRGLGSAGNLITRALGATWRALIVPVRGTIRILDALAGRLVEVGTLAARLLMRDTAEGFVEPTGDLMGTLIAKDSLEGSVLSTDNVTGTLVVKKS